MPRKNDGKRNTDEYVKSVVEMYSPNVEYIDGYINRTGPVNVKCRKCNKAFTVYYRNIAHFKRPAKCPYCTSKHSPEVQKRLYQQGINRLKRKAFEGTQIAFRVCERCGTLFIPKRKKSRFCSVRCSRNNQGNGDSRLHSLNVTDWNINLKSLADRDKDRCWLCGHLVDWNDYYMRDDGTFIAGEDYPSIDHIIPLSKGGLHAWDNVALAHRSCNSKKQDKIIKM